MYMLSSQRLTMIIDIFYHQYVCMQKIHIKTSIDKSFIHAIYIVIDNVCSRFFARRDERLKKH